MCGRRRVARRVAAILTEKFDGRCIAEHDMMWRHCFIAGLTRMLGSLRLVVRLLLLLMRFVK